MDSWSWAHLAGGGVLGLLTLHWGWILVAILGVEVVEWFLRRVPGKDGGLFAHESAANVVADVVIGFGAYVAVAWLLPGPGLWP